MVHTSYKVVYIMFLYFSYPNLKSVRELIYKRGYAKVRGQRIPLTDNSIIEKTLGKSLNFLCICSVRKTLCLLKIHQKRVGHCWIFLRYI